MRTAHAPASIRVRAPSVVSARKGAFRMREQEPKLPVRATEYEGLPGGEESEEAGVGLLEAPTTPKPALPWNVILYNDDVHTFDEVEWQLQKAIGCSLEVAEHIARTVHTEGRAVAYTGELEDCERVAGILRQIDLLVDVERCE